MVHFTGNIWSSQGAKYVYLSLTGHWQEMEASGVRQYAKAGQRWALLNVAAMKGSHTAHNIQEALKDMLQQWNLATERQGLFVTDKGTNMVAAPQAWKVEGAQPTLSS